MTKLTFFKNGKHYIGFTCEGHSGYSEQGSDIVCSAVSSATQLVCAYLLKYFKDKIDFSVDEKSAFISLKCSECFVEADRQISVLADFAQSLNEQYNNFFTYEFLEV